MPVTGFASSFLRNLPAAIDPVIRRMTRVAPSSGVAVMVLGLFAAGPFVSGAQAQELRDHPLGTNFWCSGPTTGDEVCIVSNTEHVREVARTGENGATAGPTFEVRLSSEPTANVTVSMSIVPGSAYPAGTESNYQLSPSELVFSPSDEDPVTPAQEGDWNHNTTAVNVNHPAGNSGPSVQRRATVRFTYGSRSIDGVVYVNDRDPGLVADPDSITVSEDGGTATYELYNSSFPVTDLVVTPTSANTDIATVSRPVTFPNPPEGIGDFRWRLAKTITVTGVDDDDDDDPAALRMVNITHPAVGTVFGGALPEMTVTVTVTEPEVAPVNIPNAELRAALESPVFYIGALGSTRTHAKRIARLTEAGIADDRIQRIDAPVGLDIGARSPAEIAVATMAQLTERLRRPATRLGAAPSGETP